MANPDFLSDKRWLDLVVWVWFGDLPSELSGWRSGGLPDLSGWWVGGLSKVSACASVTYQGCLGGGLAAYPSYVGGGSVTYYMLIISHPKHLIVFLIDRVIH